MASLGGGGGGGGRDLSLTEVELPPRSSSSTMIYSGNNTP